MKIKNDLIKQMVLYAIIGATSASLDFLIFYLLGTILNINEYISNVISIHTGIALSFTLNSRLNFKKTDKLALRAITFYLTGLFGLMLSSGLLVLGNALQISANLAKLASIFLVAAVQFVINKFVTFRK